jgi:hypothetical protein
MEPHIFARFRRVVVCIQATVEARYILDWPYQTFVDHAKELFGHKPLALIGDLLGRSLHRTVAQLQLYLVLDSQDVRRHEGERLRDQLNGQIREILWQTELLSGCDHLDVFVECTLEQPGCDRILAKLYGVSPFSLSHRPVPSESDG